ncbi:Bgt-20205, partial [Blumeria graminis f. sp. tritici]
SIMDHDFMIARRAIANSSLDWVSTVELILNVPHNNNTSSSPLTTYAKLNVINSGTTLDFARRLRKAFFLLPTNMVVGPQA